MKPFFRSKQLIGLTILLGLVYFALFLHLTSKPIRVWDEARLAINAYEMMQNGNPIVTYYEGAPETWNTKPPLMIWLQVLCIKVVGFNELAIRLPSALAGLMTCICLLWFAMKITGKIWLGVFATLVLIASPGYISDHIVRTGDYDSLLVLFSTLTLLFYFLAMEYSDRINQSFLLLFFVSLTLAVMTKGVAGLFFVPALFVYSFFRRKIVLIFRVRNFYIGCLIFLSVVLGYYFLREVMNPGYLQAVLKNEMGGRYLSSIEGHRADFWFYLRNLSIERFNNWLLFVPLGILVGIFHSDIRIKRLALFLTLCCIQYLILISAGQTKLIWYDAPLYPSLALIIGIFLNWIIEILSERKEFSSNPTGSSAIIIISLLVVFSIPYQKTVISNLEAKEVGWESWWYDAPKYLKQASENNKDINGYFVAYTYFPASVTFYQKRLLNAGIKTYLSNCEGLNAGSKIIVSEENLFQKIEDSYHAEVIEYNGQVRVYRIDSIR